MRRSAVSIPLGSNCRKKVGSDQVSGETDLLFGEGHGSDTGGTGAAGAGDGEGGGV